VSDDGGETFAINTTNANGDVGFPVNPGNQKMVIWNYVSEINTDGNYKIMLIADDLQPIDIQAIVDQVDSTRLRSDLESIVGIRHRTTGAAHLQEVKDMISNQYDDYNLDVEVIPFNWNNYTAENLVGRKPGLTDETETYYVNGHFDTVDDSPGADDNGSSIAGIFEIIRVLAPFQFKKSIKFVAFDLEESGLIGSTNYVNTNGIKSYENVAGVFNFEMIGYYDNAPNSQTLPAGFNQLYPNQFNEIQNDDFRGNFITNIGIYNHPDLNSAYANAAAQYVPDLKVVSLLAIDRWKTLTPDFGRSDHAPFWTKGHPALLLTDASNFRNPYYHTPNDTVGTLNFTFMSQVVKATVGALAELAEVSHSTYQMTEIEVVTSSSNFSDCDLQIFPNPISDFMRMSFPNCSHKNMAVEVINIDGKVVHSQNVDPYAESVEVSTENFINGTYILSIRRDGEAIKRKVVVNH
jgi:hypothetical protein